MRKLILSVFVLLMSVTALMAQDAETAYKNAKKALSTYELSNELAALKDAVTNLDVAMADATIAGDVKAQLKAGDIYNQVINKYTIDRQLSPDAAELIIPDAARRGAMAYMKAYELAEKKGDMKKALTGLEQLQGSITNEGIYGLQDQKYDQALSAFQMSMKVDQFIKDNGGNSSLTEEALNQDIYYAALSAQILEDMATAKPLLEQLYAAEFPEAGIYDGLYKVYMAEGDKEKAGKVLAEGRMKHPEETSLLFNEINYYLQEGRLDELVGKIEEAITKEPTNMSLYATKAQVYEQLYRKETEAGNAEKAAEYYTAAEEEYNRGLEQDPNAANLIYGLGILIYNNAAAMSQQLDVLGDDLTREGQKKYEAVKTQVDAEFAKALPFFQKAEMADPNNANVLTALREMYARSGEYEVSGEFKTRLETVQGGGEVSGSYFKSKGM